MGAVPAFKPSKQKDNYWDTIGVPARGGSLYKALHKGLPYSVIGKICEVSGLDKSTVVSTTDIAQATLQRRAKRGSFNKDESDRLYRIAAVYKATLDLFSGDQESAKQWLVHEVRGLGGKRPIDMLSTSAETEAVLNLIGRLEHGVYA